MDTRTALPIYPDPPREYRMRWAADLIRALDQLNVLLRNPGEGRNTRITLTELPTEDVGLEPGAVFRSGNVLMIALPDSPFITGYSSTASLGTVTVTV